ncbi:hypothetical protein MD484_g6237, partial [Candolleomyces efflorescens]
MVVSLPRRSDKLRLRLLILTLTILVLLLFLVSQRERISIPSALQWRPKSGNGVQQDTDPLSTNHTSEDNLDTVPGEFDLDSGHPTHPTPLVKPNTFLAPTNEETTIPSTPISPTTSSSAHPNVPIAPPGTSVQAHAYGFTLFDKLYLRNGTLYVVTADRGAFPPRDRILFKSEGVQGGMGVEATDQELVFISPGEEVKRHLGEFASVLGGVTVLVYDPWQFLPFVDSDSEWRDKAALNGPLMRLAFPGCTIEQAGQWKDWKRPLSWIWPKMISGTMNLTVPTHYWEPIRASLTRSLFGYVPHVDKAGHPSSSPPTSFSESESEHGTGTGLAYIFDYEILARNMGHKHYLVRNDTMLTFKPGDWYREGVHVPEGFHGERIPVHGRFVGDLIRERLTQPEEDVEE